MKRMMAGLAALVLLICVAVPAWGGEKTDWTQFRGDAGTPGITESRTPISAKDTKELWGKAYGGDWDYPGSPIVVGGSLYTLVAAQNALLRIDKATGEVVKKVECPGSSQYFSMIGYGEGMLFVPRSQSEKVNDRFLNYTVIYAYDEETMELLWKTEPLGTVEKGFSPMGALTVYQGYLYTGVCNGSPYDQGLFACYKIDKEASAVPKTAVWTYAPESGAAGYYWSGAAAAGDSLLFAGEAGELVSHALADSQVKDTLLLEGGAVRSAVAYDAASSRAYAATTGGVLTSVKVKGDGSFDRNSIRTAPIVSNCTSSPLVYRGRLYLGNGGFGAERTFSVLDAETLEVIYTIEGIHTQSSPVLSTHYATAENQYQVYVYVVGYGDYKNGDYQQGYTEDSSSLFVIKDHAGQTQGQAEQLAQPSVPQFCSQTVAVDGDGTLYYYNDSARLFAFANTAKEEIPEPAPEPAPNPKPDGNPDEQPVPPVPDREEGKQPESEPAEEVPCPDTGEKGILPAMAVLSGASALAVFLLKRKKG